MNSKGGPRVAVIQLVVVGLNLSIIYIELGYV